MMQRINPILKGQLVFVWLFSHYREICSLYVESQAGFCYNNCYNFSQHPDNKKEQH